MSHKHQHCPRFSAFQFSHVRANVAAVAEPVLVIRLIPNPGIPSDPLYFLSSFHVTFLRVFDLYIIYNLLDAITVSYDLHGSDIFTWSDHLVIHVNVGNLRM